MMNKDNIEKTENNDQKTKAKDKDKIETTNLKFEVFDGLSLPYLVRPRAVSEMPDGPNQEPPRRSIVPRGSKRALGPTRRSQAGSTEPP